MFRKNKENTGYIYVAVAGTLWGTAGMFVKGLSMLGLTDRFISFCRIFPAFIILLTINVLKNGFSSLIIDYKTIVFCGLSGIICQSMYNFCYTSCITYTSVSIAAVLLYIAPVITVLLSWAFFGEKITKVKVEALAINIIGEFLTVTGGEIDNLIISTRGIFFGLAAALCYSLSAVFGKSIASKYDSLTITTIIFFFASLSTAILSKPWNEIVYINFQSFLIVLMYSLIPTALAYIVYYAGLKYKIEVGRVPIISSVELIVATVIGVIIYKEVFGLVHFVGILMILCSVAMINIRHS